MEIEEESNKKLYLGIIVGAFLLLGIIMYFSLRGKEETENQDLSSNKLKSILEFLTLTNPNTFNNVSNKGNFNLLNTSNPYPYNNLIGYWNFDSDNSSTAFDYSKYNNNGRYLNGALSNSSSGLYGNGSYFDGVNDYIDIPFINNLGLNGSSNFTVSFWATCKNNVLDKALFSMGNKSSLNGLLIIYPCDTSGGNGTRIFYNNTNIINENGVNRQGGAFHHYVIVQSNNTNVTLIIDNVIIANSNVPNSLSNQLTNITIGGWTNQLLGNSTVDDLMIFSTSLNIQEVSDIYLNQSNRFRSIGNITYQNLNLEGNSSIEINLSNYQNILGSNILGQFSNSTTNGSLNQFNIISGIGSIPNYILSSFINKSNMTLTLFYIPNGTIFSTSITNSSSLVDTLSTNPLMHWVDTSLDNTIDNCNLTTTFIASVGTVNVTINNVGVGTITTTDTSPKTFINVCSYIIRGLNNVTYAPTVAATITISASNLSYRGYRDFYSPLSGFNITITDTTPPIADNEYPIFSSYLNSPASSLLYSPGTNYSFNVSILSSNATAGIEFAGVNFSLSNITNLFNKTFQDLGAGTYNFYYWSYGNGTAHNYNISQSQTYLINKTSSSVFTFIDSVRASKTIFNTTLNTNLSGQLITGTGTIRLYVNNILYNTGTPFVSNLTNFTVPGTYTINTTYLGNTNYTFDDEVWSLIVSGPVNPNQTISNSLPICPYKRFGYYDLDLMAFQKVNCI